MRTASAMLIAVLMAGMGVIETQAEVDGTRVTDYEWTEVNPAAAWEPRAGLRVLRKGDRLYLLGGRTPRPPSFRPYGLRIR
jgi:hypothetical protein